MAGEPQYTPEIARQLTEIIAHPEQTQHDRTLESARQKWQEKQSEKSLQIIEGTALPSTIEDDRLVIKDKFSSARDSEGNKTNPTESHERRWERQSRLAVEEARAFIENGALSDNIISDIRGYLERNSHPCREIIQGLISSGGNVDNFVRGLIENNPGFKGKLIEVYNSSLQAKSSEVEKTVLSLETDLSVLKSQLAGSVSEADVDAVQQAVNSAEDVVRRNNVDVNEYQSNKSTREELGPEITQARVLLRDTSIQTQHDFNEQRIQEIKAALPTLTPGSADYNRAIAALNQLQVDPNYQRFQDAQEIVQRYDSADRYLRGLTQNARNAIVDYERSSEKLINLKSKLQTATSPQERAKIEAQINGKQIELAEARVQLTSEKIEAFNKFILLPEEAMEIYLTGTFSQIKDIFGVASAETNETILESLDNFSHVWKIQETDRRGITFWTTRRASAQEVMTAFLNGGNDGVQQYFMDRIMPGGVLNENFLRNRGFSDNQIDALRNRFSTEEGIRSFFKENGKKFGVDSIADYLVSGGRLTRNILEAFVSTDSGQELIQSAIDRSKDIRSKLDQMVGKDVTSAMDNIKTGGKEFLKKNWWKFGLAILAILMLLGGIKGVAA